jgi:hypothetical protein
MSLLALVTCRDVVIKTVVAHTVTYFIVGAAAFILFDYRELITSTAFGTNFRPLDHPLIIAGPLLQPIRGGLFGLMFYLLRVPFFGSRHGWLVMWATLVVFGILGTFAAPAGSIEGMIYTTLPLSLHLIGLPEVLVQSLLLSCLVFYWVTSPEKRWIGWTLRFGFGLVIVLLATVLIAMAMGLGTT